MQITANFSFPFIYFTFFYFEPLRFLAADRHCAKSGQSFYLAKKEMIKIAKLQEMNSFFFLYSIDTFIHVAQRLMLLIMFNSVILFTSLFLVRIFRIQAAFSFFYIYIPYPVIEVLPLSTSRTQFFLNLFLNFYCPIFFA